MAELLRGADGKVYREQSDGDYVEFEVPPGHEVVDTAAGARLRKQQQLIIPGTEADIPAMRDQAEYERQREMSSSDDFFTRQRQDRQKLKRKEAVERQVQQMVGDRVDPGPSAGVRQVKDEQYMDLQRTYLQAAKEGRAKDCEFQPVSAYQHKVVRARPILKGEVGILNGTILVLEEGYGAGTLVQVSDEIRTETQDGEEADTRV